MSEFAGLRDTVAKVELGKRAVLCDMQRQSSWQDVRDRHASAVCLMLRQVEQRARESRQIVAAAGLLAKRF